MTHIGIVAALPNEARCLGAARARLGKQYELNANAVLRVSGMGRANATAAAQALSQNGAAALVSWGFCGALDASLPAGMLVLPATVVDAQNETEFSTDVAWRNRLRDKLVTDDRLTITDGPVLSCMSAIRSTEEKQRLRQTSGAVAVDMESTAIASVALQCGAPFIAIRTIVDTANMQLPSTALAMTNADGLLQLRHGLTHWLCHPAQTGAMLHLIRNARAARHSLRQTVALAGPQLLYTAGG